MGRKRSVSGEGLPEVRTTSLSGSNPGSQGFPGGANSRPEQVQQTTHACALFDHLVGNGQQTRRNGEIERLRGRQVDNELKPGRLQNWKVNRPFAL
jgi:hypothetical protein